MTERDAVAMAFTCIGEGAAYTRRRRPVRLVWNHQTDSIRDAYLLEKQVQGWSHAKRQALVEGRFEDLPDLARTAVSKES